MSAGLKAGLIGAAAGFLVSLLSLIPMVGCCFSLAGLLVYVGAGALAAFWLVPPRSAGAGAGQGAIAGVLSGLGSSIVSTIMAIVYGLTGSGRSMLDATTMAQLEEAGLDPEMFSMFASTGGSILGGAMCCVGGLLLGAALGAIGGAITAAIKRD